MKLGRFETNNIYNEDCYKAIKDIPNNCIDLIIIDPPYELEIEGGKKNNINKTFANCLSQISYISEGINLEILDEFMRVLKTPNIYIWCNKKQIPDYLDYFVQKHKCSFEIMCWIKSNPTPLCGGNYLIDKEFCLYFRKGVKLNTSFSTASTYWITPKNKRDKDKYLHPTIKPKKIIDTLITNSCDKGGVVADFFVGSGTTCVSAKDTGRQYIGFEIDKKWFDIAKDRLSNIDSMGQHGMFLK